MPDIVSRVITVTTRPRRGGEVDGVHYRFVTEGAFKKLVSQGRFFEFAYVYGNWYGTLREDVEAAFRKVPAPLLVLDIQGAATIAKKLPDAVLVGILLKREEALPRLRGRGDTAIADVTVRANNFGREELALRKICTCIVENSDGAFPRAVETLQRFITHRVV